MLSPGAILRLDFNSVAPRGEHIIYVHNLDSLKMQCIMYAYCVFNTWYNAIGVRL